MVNENNMKMLQEQMCELYGIKYEEVHLNTLIAVSKNVKDGSDEPLNGVRHPITKENKIGWYLWAGEELSESYDFFEPMHLYHLKDYWPEAIKFLGLASGSRFLIDKQGYEDVWTDDALFDID